MAGMVPKAKVIAAERRRPRGMNQRGLLRSETEPMRNFEMP